MVFGLSLALVVPAIAQPDLPAAVYGANVGGVREGVLDSGPFGEHNGNTTVPAFESLIGGQWAVGASADDTDGGTVIASALVTLPPRGQQTYVSSLQAQSELTYFFSLVGPDPDAVVPVILNAAGSNSLTEGAYGDVGLYFAGKQWRAEGYAGSPAPNGFAVDDLFYLQPDQVYSLTIYAQVKVDFHLGVTTDGISQAGATVDPTFQIQGAFADLYHFVGLPGSSIASPPPPTEAVPALSTWAMMLLGFSALAYAGYQGRRNLVTI